MFGTPGQRPAPLPESALDADYAYPFSSGTTGLPKAVRHTHRSLVAAVINWNSACAVREEDHVQFFLPLFHIYGIAITGCTWVSAATITLFPRFDLDAMLSHIEQTRVTLAFGAAPIAVAMANHPELEKYDLSSLRYMMWAATPIAEDVANRVTERTGLRWLGAYGATELPGLHCNPVDYPDRSRLDTPGLPVSDLEVRIVDLETHEDVAPGTEGEIIVRGPHMMAGYLPAESDADAFLDGWLRTGDVGWVEPEGWIHITDRAKEMIKVSGFSVAPAEIEATLHGHPAVADCGVYGVPHATKGEVPKAAIVLTAPDAATADDLRAYVAERLAGYKHVEDVVFVDAIPAHRIGQGPAPHAEGHRRVARRRPMSIAAIGTYLPPWGSAAARVAGRDEDALTMAVQAGRAALGAGGAGVDHVVFVTRDLPLLDGGNGAALVAGLGLPATDDGRRADRWWSRGARRAARGRRRAPW